MRQYNNLKKIDNKYSFQILTASVIVTLYFMPSIEDPFNSPKMWLLMIFGSWLLGLVVFTFKIKFRQGLDSKLKTFVYLLLSFNITLFFSTILTDVSLIGFFGDTQRRIGFVTYFFLSIFALAAAIIFNESNSIKILYAALICGGILSSYGFFQSIGRDFIAWQNPYNQVLGTLGNPNFASAALALFACLSFSTLFAPKVQKSVKVLALLVFALSFYVIYQSKSIQGLVALTVGIGFFLYIVISNKYKIRGRLFLIFYLLSGTLSILGMLQTGPLKNWLYKDSVSVRGYYWRAGFQMFKENIISGVGVDRYGYWFKQLREPTYSLKYGYDITSSNAHSIPIQMFATSGLLVGILYFAIFAYTLVKSIKYLKLNSDIDKTTLTALVAALIVYLAQSVISIENIGLGIWGWLLLGAIIGLSSSYNKQDKTIKSNVPKDLNPAHLILSWVLVLLVLVPISYLYRVEKTMFLARDSFNYSEPANSPNFFTLSDQLINLQMADENYKYRIAYGLSQAGQTDKSKSILIDLHATDYRNLDVLELLANIYEAENNLSEAITYRNKINRLDPWNAKNLVFLAEYYKKLQNFDKVAEISREVIKMAPGSLESDLAAKNLMGN